MEQRKLSFAQNASFNTIGTLIYGFCLWLTTLSVVRYSQDYTNAGVWQLSISITNIFAAIAVFNLSQYYVSDVENKYDIGDYFGAQLLTCFFSVFLCCIYSLVFGYRREQLFCVILYMVCRAIEAYSGLHFGVEQKNYRMDYVGISIAIRGILELAGFTIVLRLTQNVTLAVIPMVLVSFLMLIFYDEKKTKMYVSAVPKFSLPRLKSVIVESFFSVISISAFTAINTIPRQIFEKISGEKDLGFYATIAAPIVALQVIAVNVFNPILQDLAIAYKNNNAKKLRLIALKYSAMLVALTVVTFAGCKLFGRFLYVFIYGSAIEEYYNLIYAVIFTAILYSACWACWNMLVVMRKTSAMLFLSIFSMVIASISAKPLILLFGMNGISFSIIIAYFVFVLIFAVYFTIVFCREKEKFEN